MQSFPPLLRSVVVFDASYLEIEADRLLRHAERLRLRYALGGLVPGVVGLALVWLSDRPWAEGPVPVAYAAAIAIAGLTVGGWLGDLAAFRLRLQAHQLLALVQANRQIEELAYALTCGLADVNRKLAAASGAASQQAAVAQLERVEEMLAEVLSRLYRAETAGRS